MTRRMRERRTDDEFRVLDNRRRAISHKIERQDKEFKTEENKRRAEALKFARQDDEFKTEDNKRRAKAHKIERQDDEFKTEDNKRRAEAHKIERQDDEFKTEDLRPDVTQRYHQVVLCRSTFPESMARFLVYTQLLKSKFSGEYFFAVALLVAGRKGLIIVTHSLFRSTT
jgi:hypothetical protein